MNMSLAPIFSDLTAHGIYGMAFTTEDPNRRKTEYGLERTIVFQFNTQLEKNRINPLLEEHEELFRFMIKEFSSEAPDSIVLVEGLDVFLGVERFGENIGYIKEWMKEHRCGRLLLVVSPETVEGFKTCSPNPLEGCIEL